MKNKIDLVNDCFSALLRTGVTTQATPDEQERALYKLEDMMAELESRNLATGYNFEDTPQGDSPSGLENWMSLAISESLAVRIWTDFSPEMVNPRLEIAARQSMANLSARLAQQRALQYAGRTPLGTGNQPWQQYRKFYGNLSTSDCGAGSCGSAFPIPPAPTPVGCECDAIPIDHLKQLYEENTATASGKVFFVTSFYSGWEVDAPKGGGQFVWNPTASKSTHNGITVIAPEALAAWDGTQVGLAALIGWTGSGVGCWVKVLNEIPTVDMAGGSFSAAAAAFSGEFIRIPSGSYSVGSAIQGKWLFDGGVTLTGSGKLVQSERGFWSDVGSGADFNFVRDRLFVGDACDASLTKNGGVDKSWVGYSAGGYMTYYDTRSQSASYSTIGGIAHAAASRTSDSGTGELNTIGHAAYVKNDNINAADKKSAWAIYGHAAHLSDNLFTTSIETDICSVQPLVSVNPYLMGAPGTTAGYWLGVGGETAQQLVDSGQGSTLKNVSAALAVINSASGAVDNRFAKGIVFQATSLAGTNGTGTGSATAIELARGHRIVGKYNTAVEDYSGQIRFDGGAGATSQIIEMGTTQFLVKGYAADFATEHNLIGVQATAVPAGQSTNWFFFNPSVTGTGSIQTQAAGVDANIQYLIQGKGTGGVSLRDGNTLTKFSINTTGIGFYGTAPTGKPTVTGSKGGNAALDSLLQALAALGLITNSTT